MSSKLIYESSNFQFHGSIISQNILTVSAVKRICWKNHFWSVETNCHNSTGFCTCFRIFLNPSDLSFLPSTEAPILRDPHQITNLPTKEIADGDDLHGGRIKLSVRKIGRESFPIPTEKSKRSTQNFEPSNQELSGFIARESLIRFAKSRKVQLDRHVNLHRSAQISIFVQS